MKKIFQKIAFLALGSILVLGQMPLTVSALEIVVSDNGSGSESEVKVSQETQTTVTQTNEANIANDVNVDANTGENTANDNTGGDVSLQTGDIKENVSIENSVNSSFVETECCPQDTTATITANGAESENKINLEIEQKTQITINQLAYITNNIQGSANTGGNTANDNLGGNVTIETGSIRVSGGIQNGPINSVSLKGGSGGGSISAKISGNGANSENEIEAAFDFDSDIFLNFESNIDNFLNWDLNTGKNEASGNTGGNIKILTGDIFFDFFIKNGPINFGQIFWGCCDIFDPGEPNDEEPLLEEPPTDQGEQDNGGDGQDKDNGEDEDDEGKLLAEAAAVEAGGPGIAGLSDTSSGLARTIFFWAGLAMMLLGTHFLGREAYAKLQTRKNGK